MLTATRPQLTIKRIGKHLGAEICGVDLSQPGPLLLYGAIAYLAWRFLR